MPISDQEGSDIGQLRDRSACCESSLIRVQHQDYS
jgi:hypothetical protein